MSQEWKEPAAGADVQMPLGTGGDAAAGEEYSAPKVRVNTSTLALIASFVAALAVLYFMGMQNKPRPASGDDLKRMQANEDTIKSWLGNTDVRQSLKQTSDRLLEKLRQYLGETKDVAADLGDNPFKQAMKDAPPPALPPMVADANPMPQLPPETVDAGLKEVAKTFPSLKLQLVMLGNPSSAMINSQMASVGTKFGLLKVTEIENDRVLLTYEGTGGKKYVFPLYINGSSADPNAGFGGSKPR
jgi:hypothetical protein